jgi:hypothetical protein
MAKLIVAKDLDPHHACRELESGNILFFQATPFSFPEAHIQFLLEQKQGESSARKNIAYKPSQDKVTNHDTSNPETAKKMHATLRHYSDQVTLFLSQFLAPYAAHWRLDYASFRPFQEQGRKLRIRARNDLLHVDAFPTRPMHGARILRFFTNINPKEPRQWITSKPFEELLAQFGGKEISYPRSPRFSVFAHLERTLKQWARLPLRSPYDDFMLRFHNFLKENTAFQQNTPKDAWAFPPGSCWIVFTDQVSHAALSGQFALEQTILVPHKGLLYPDNAPISHLERATRGNMIDPVFAQKTLL